MVQFSTNWVTKQSMFFILLIFFAISPQCFGDAMCKDFTTSATALLQKQVKVQNHVIAEEHYEQAGWGVAGPTEKWNVGGAQGQGVEACYNAVIADSQCAQDYFTYVSRGDRNCGCKVSSG